MLSLYLPGWAGDKQQQIMRQALGLLGQLNSIGSNVLHCPLQAVPDAVELTSPPRLKHIVWAEGRPKPFLSNALLKDCICVFSVPLSRLRRS
jgi:hypothetical protein